MDTQQFIGNVKQTNHGIDWGHEYKFEVDADISRTFEPVGA